MVTLPTIAYHSILMLQPITLSFSKVLKIHPYMFSDQLVMTMVITLPPSPLRANSGLLELFTYRFTLGSLGRLGYLE